MLGHRALLKVWAYLPPWLQNGLADRLNARWSLGVCAIMRSGDGVMLADHPHKYPRWQLPGGYMKRGEMPAEALRREMDEELGLRVEECQLLHVDGRRGHLTLYYTVEVSGVCRPSVEVSGAESLWPGCVAGGTAREPAAGDCVGGDGRVGRGRRRCRSRLSITVGRRAYGSL